MADRNLPMGERLKQLRGRRTKTDIAALVPCAVSTLGRWEDEGRIPDAQDLQRLADIYGTTQQWLLSGQDKEGNSDESYARAVALATKEDILRKKFLTALAECQRVLAEAKRAIEESSAPHPAPRLPLLEAATKAALDDLLEQQAASRRTEEIDRPGGADLDTQNPHRSPALKTAKRQK